MKRKLREYGIKFLDVDSGRYYGVLVQRFPRRGKPSVVESLSVPAEELWRNTRARLDELPLADKFVRINAGALPRKYFTGIVRLGKLHNKRVSIERRLERQRRAEKRSS
jgi:hypothetical protein